jgi:hypothetical protein
MQRCKAIEQAIAFKAEYPTENASTSARIYHAKESSVRMALKRQRDRNSVVPIQNGGQNKILSDAQVKALTKYVEDLYFSGLGATKPMVLGAITHLRAAENLPKKAPSTRWFQAFLKSHPDLFRTVKAKPIAIARISAQDVEEVRKWFVDWTAFYKEKGLQPSDVLNFDETGFRVGVTSGEELLIPAWATEVDYLSCLFYYIPLLIVY